MNKARGFILAVAAAAIAFTVSCTSDIETAEEFLAKLSSSSEGNSSSSSRQNSSSSSALPSSSSSSVSGVIYGTPVNYGGETYQTVVIGSQTWFAKNLNYDVSGSKCYENKPENCAKYGRLYNWATAMNNSASSTTVPSGVRGICPAGWHLPSDAEWKTLTDYVGDNAGPKLKAKSGWNQGGNGTDAYGFSALPGGYGLSDGSFYNVGNNGNWWSASEYYSGDAYSRYMTYNDEDAYWVSNNKSLLFSVRCLQD